VPTYQYACTDCAESLEAVQKFTDAPLTECPACGGALRKVFTPVGVVFKGSGFYKTDSRGSSSAAPSKESAPAASSESSGSSSSESSSGSSSSGSSSGSSSPAPSAPPASGSSPAAAAS
jgi:putative FmdB family regulatory protein